MVQLRGTVIHVDYRSHCQSQLSNVRDVNGTVRQADNARQLRGWTTRSEVRILLWIVNDRLTRVCSTPKAASQIQGI